MWYINRSIDQSIPTHPIPNPNPNPNPDSPARRGVVLGHGVALGELAAHQLVEDGREHFSPRASSSSSPPCALARIPRLARAHGHAANHNQAPVNKRCVCRPSSLNQNQSIDQSANPIQSVHNNRTAAASAPYHYTNLIDFPYTPYLSLSLLQQQQQQRVSDDVDPGRRPSDSRSIDRPIDRPTDPRQPLPRLRAHTPVDSEIVVWCGVWCGFNAHRMQCPSWMPPPPPLATDSSISPTTTRRDAEASLVECKHLSPGSIALFQLARARVPVRRLRTQSLQARPCVCVDLVVRGTERGGAACTRRRA